MLNDVNPSALFTLAPVNPAICNQYGDELFQIQDPLTGKFYTISFAWNCSMAKRLYAQMYFLQGDISRGYADDKGRIVVSSLSSARQELAYLRELCEYWEMHFPDRALQSLSRLDIQMMLRFLMIRKENNEGGGEILGISTMTMVCKILDRTNKMLHAGKLVDGVIHRMTEPFRKSTMEPLLKELEVEYAVWKKGGSYGSIPLTCASLMLAEAITLLESDEAKIAVIFFAHWRNLKTKTSSWFGEKDRLALYRRMQSPGYVLSRFERGWAPSAEEFGSAIDNATKAHHKALPWKSLGGLADFCSELTKAALTVITLLSGFRIVEIHGMKISDYEQEPDGSWWFTSENNKTESGFSHPRSLHGLAAEAATLMKGLSAVDTDEFNLPLIHRGYRSEAFDVACGRGRFSDEDWLADAGYSTLALRKWFKDFYWIHVVEKYPEAGEIHNEVSPHQARHTFAEFALRRFDGNVMEKIREHFRHSYGSFHTRRYTREKLSESVRISMERDYAKEVMERIAHGSLDDRFYGPAAKRIDKEMAEISVLTGPEFDGRVQALANEFVRFTAFEWGFCALRGNEQHIAKCHDPKTGTPNVDQRSAPEVCAGCPHSMNNQLQKLELERTAIAHQSIADTHSLKVLRDMSTEVVKKIERRLVEKVSA
ncbi:site-specific integrase [Pseudomonas frederiksbergensis]|nr:site-specific integrase [Pseudomonas frederiksbergensis]